MVTIMIPQIRFSDRPLTVIAALTEVEPIEQGRTLPGRQRSTLRAPRGDRNNELLELNPV